MRIRTPSLLQLEAVECGAAALGMLLSYWGRIVPLAQLREDCGISRDGSKASSIIKAARQHGMLAKGFSKDTSTLHEVTWPCILFWNFNHFLVLEGLDHKRAYLNDPAMGHRSVSLREFEESFTGVVLAMEPGPDFEKGGEWPSVWKGLLSRLTGFRDAILFAILAGFLLVIPRLMIPAVNMIPAAIRSDMTTLLLSSDWEICPLPEVPAAAGLPGLVGRVLEEASSRSVRAASLSTNISSGGGML